MKKNLVALLLVLAVVSVGLFAEPDITKTFNLTTSVQGVNKMKITAAEFTGSPGQFDGAEEAVTHVVSTYGNQQSIGSDSLKAWLSTISNNRAGYTVKMTATPLKSVVEGQTTAYIDYTVTVNNKSIATQGSSTTNPAFQNVITVASLAGVARQSHQLTIVVDQTTFEAAVEGEYTGTVTFDYTAN
ncbi:MAG: hypothetical protein GX313_04925 [Spirochaetales bacterium]|nr:hypothetical protein [Spirochaetales bacterium]